MRRVPLVAVLLASCYSKPDAPQLTTDDAQVDGIGGDTVPNVAFVTSGTFTPNALGGLDGADITCTQLAASARLTGRFRAWLSSPTMSAAQRFAGYRGWVRTDGAPFADELSELEAGHVLNPLRRDETGVDHVQLVVATGTEANGQDAANADCNGFNGSSGGGVLMRSGVGDGGTGLWTAVMPATATCSTPAALYCLQYDYSTIIDDVGPKGKRVFLADEQRTGNTSLAQFDALCQSEATMHGLSGTFLAYLATTMKTAADRFAGVSGPWYRLDGVKVSDDLHSLVAPINVTAGGTYLTAEVYFGAPTPIDTGTQSSTCADWGDVGPLTSTGSSGRSTTAAFSGEATRGCITSQYIYCAEL